jgi:lysozyme
MKIKMVALSMISFMIAISSCVIALNIDTVKKPKLASTSEAPVSSEQTSSNMHSNGPANMKLIDISNHDNVTDWHVLKSMIDGVYMKATEDTTYIDTKLNTYATAAIGEKIPIGFYHFFWPNANVAYAKQQADYFYNAIKGYNYQLYPVLDVEETKKLSVSVIVANVKAFADEFEHLTNQRVIIYCSQNFANQYLADPSLASYQLWIAHYGVPAPGNTTTWSRYVMWQYGEKGTIAGISGSVDMDVATTNVFINESSIDE